MNNYSFLFPGLSNPDAGQRQFVVGNGSAAIKARPTPQGGNYFATGVPALDGGGSVLRSTSLPSVNLSVNYHYNVMQSFSPDPSKLQISESNIGAVVFAHESESGRHAPLPAHFTMLVDVDTLNTHVPAEVDTFEKFKYNFRFIGVVKNEVMRHVNRTKSRVFNLCVADRVSCQNYWKECEPRALDRLGFELRIDGKNALSLNPVKNYTGPPSGYVHVGLASTGPLKNGTRVEGRCGWPCAEMIEIYLRK